MSFATYHHNTNSTTGSCICKTAPISFPEAVAGFISNFHWLQLFQAWFLFETKNCTEVKLDPKTPCALAEQLISADSQLMSRQSAEYFPDTSPVSPSIASNSFLLEKRSKSSMITKQACGSKSLIKPRSETKSATFQLRTKKTAILQYTKPFPKFSEATGFLKSSQRIGKKHNGTSKNQNFEIFNHPFARQETQLLNQRNLFCESCCNRAWPMSIQV